MEWRDGRDLGIFCGVMGFDDRIQCARAKSSNLQPTNLQPSSTCDLCLLSIAS